MLESAKGKFEKGLISEAELNFAEIKDRQNHSMLKSTQNSLEQLYVQLQSQLNLKEEIMIHDKAGGFAFSENIKTPTHIDILWQQTAVKKSEAQLKQSKSLYAPSLSLAYGYNYTWTGDDFMNFSDVNALPQQYLGLQVNIPIFKGFSTKNKVSQAEQELYVQKMQLDNTILVKQKEDEMLQLQLEQASDQLKENKKILSLYEKNDATPKTSTRVAS